MKYLTRTVWLLSLVSLFNDICSEMLYPVMPLFLESIGFSSVLIGIMEGVAEATGGLSKGYFGRISDATGRRMPFVRAGYILSAFAKSAMALVPYPLWIYLMRATDRLGKGLRTGARDAVLSDETTAQNKGKVFGFHRALDTTGAAIGPTVALLYLLCFPRQYKPLFLLAFIPAAAGIALTFFIKEKKHPPAQKLSFKFGQTFNYFSQAPKAYRQLVLILLLFALFNSSDIFLLMKIKQSGWNDTYVIGSYILYNLIYALAAFPLGQMADKIGLKQTLLIGLLIFTAVYAGFGFNTGFAGYILLFTAYGFYAAATEGVSKALLSNLVPKNESASALGTFAGLSSLVAMLSSTLAGLLWKFVSPQAVFFFSGAGALLSAALLYFLHIKRKADKAVETIKTTERL